VIEPLARKLLYDRYVLYPSRADSTKNRHRFSFGTLYPRTWCETERNDDCALRTEVLVTTREIDSISISIRFLRFAGNGKDWYEAHENAIELAAGPGGKTDVKISGLELGAAFDDGDSTLIRVLVSIETPLALPADAAPARRRAVQLSSLASTHMIYRSPRGGFVSLLEPPASLAAPAGRCVNLGAWPVLVGTPGATDAMLGAPIILDDYPGNPAGSTTDLYDASETDEILAPRLLALSEPRKAQVRAIDPRARAILERSERF
jgi:hypothetical protein